MKPFSRFLLILAACVSAVAASSAWADPPGRVGRISLIGGSVSLYNDQYGEQQGAGLNWPVTTGDILSTASGSRAEVRIGSTAIRLDGDSQLEFAALDDQQLRLRLLRGTVAVRVRDIEQARQFTLTTPQGSVALHDVGAYRFEAGWRPDTTAVAAFQGAAVFTGEGLSLSVRSGQRAEIFGERNLGYAITAAVQGDFDIWSLARDRRDDEARSVRYVSREMTGYEDLDGYGDWRETVEYGPVWYPRRVPAGWAPYRTGHWAWVQPWGWTWIDEAPWGFAPFHYGRWAFIGGVWGWVPGPVVAYPVYAPALVVWVGRPGWQLSFSIGTGPAVGWFPLGPREVFVPAFRCSTVFVQRINAPHVTNITQIVNVQREPHRAHYANRSHRDAVTIVPSNVVSGGAPVSRHALRQAQAPSIGSLPDAAPAPAIAPPQRRERMAAPEPRSVVPQRPAATPGADTTDDGRRTIRRREAGPTAPAPRSGDAVPAAPRESRPVVVPPAAAPATPAIPATPATRAVPAAPATAPEDARRGTTRSREVERTAPPSRRMDTVAPVQTPSPRIEREAQRPAADPRHPAPAPTQDAAPSQRRSTTRDAGPSPRATEPPREDRKGEAVRERRDDGRDRGSEGREGGRGGRPGPN